MLKKIEIYNQYRANAALRHKKSNSAMPLILTKSNLFKIILATFFMLKKRFHRKLKY
jgi:hypothetical protein